jgi:hypothetical protein
VPKSTLQFAAILAAAPESYEELQRFPALGAEAQAKSWVSTARYVEVWSFKSSKWMLYALAALAVASFRTMIKLRNAEQSSAMNAFLGGNARFASLFAAPIRVGFRLFPG